MHEEAQVKRKANKTNTHNSPGCFVHTMVPVCVFDRSFLPSRSRGHEFYI